MSEMEKNLRKYLDTRDAIIDQAVREVGPVGAHEHVTERRVLAQVRAVMEGRYCPSGSAK